MPSQDLLLRIARNAKRIRGARGRTQEQVAEAGGLRPNQVSKLERCRLQPTLATLVALAEGLGCDVADLVDRDGEATSVALDVAAVGVCERLASSGALDELGRLNDVDLRALATFLRRWPDAAQ